MGLRPTMTLKMALLYLYVSSGLPCTRTSGTFVTTGTRRRGGLWSWYGAQKPAIINLFTQEGAYDHGSKPGKASVQNVNHCMRALRKELEKGEIKSLALPRLATGVGGLSWEDVKPLIESHLGDLDIPIYIYTEFHAGEEAEEAGL